MAPCGEPVVPCEPRVGLQRIGILGSVEAPLPLIDAATFLRGMCPPYHLRRLYVLKHPWRPRPLTFSEEVCFCPHGARIP